MKKIRHRTIREALGRDPVHPFPARMAPSIVFRSIATNARRRLRVLDPMMGSGTVLAIARKKGHAAVGFDVDPLAAMIARVWTTPISTKKLTKAAMRVLSKATKLSISLTHNDTCPRGCDKATRKFIKYWFDLESRRQLTALSTTILRIRDIKVREALLCAFSRLIIAKSSGASLARDLAHSRPHKFYDLAPVRPFDNFMSAVTHVARNSISRSSTRKGPRASARIGDARRLTLRANSVDLALTSPPYLNAIDYIRCSKFSLVWMGFGVDQLSQVRRVSVGSEVGKQLDDSSRAVMRRLKLKRKLPTRHSAILARFIGDMQTSLSEVARVLVPGGKAIYVVGENTVRGVYIRNSVIVSEAARAAGLRLTKKSSRRLPRNRRYLPPPVRKDAKEFDSRMGREVILVFRKPKN